jgi:sigma-B regulation protein RsbU (phosphoserine phosphatase)
VFMKNDDGKLRLAAGRNNRDEPLLDDSTISRSILEDALKSNSEFVLTDTSRSLDLDNRKSIVAYDLRTVICVPLRKPQVQTTRDTDPGRTISAGAEAMGALYVDSRFASHDISGVSTNILHAIATEAASLIENARLVQAEDASRRYQQELTIAATIQQRLMAVTIPEVPFARLTGRNLSCKEIGGDFFDAVNTPDGLAVVHKHIGEKYATLVLARLRRDGELEYVNCGHVQPLMICNGEVMRPAHGNVPVGLLPGVTYESDRCNLHAGDRLILVTDGVTEAEDASGDFFDNERLEAAAKTGGMEEVFAAVSTFCAGTPLNDDCTVVEMTYTGDSATASQP